MEKQAGQSLPQPQNLKNDKKIIRFAPGIIRNSSSSLQISGKSSQPLSEQSAGSTNGAQLNNYPGSCSKPSTQIGDPSNLVASSTTQAGFFRRKMHLKMSTTGFKIFNSKLQSDNAPALPVKKARLTSNHLSQGNPFLQGSSPLQQQFSSQSIQPTSGNQPSVTSSQSPFCLQITNQRNETHSIHSSISTWMGNHRPSIPSSELLSNQLSRGIRSSGFIGACQRSKTAASAVKNEDGIEKEIGQQQQTKKEDANEENKEETNIIQSQKLKKSALRKPSPDRNADQDSSCLEESQANQGSSLQTPMENYSHNTESTNVTTAQSHSVSQHAFFDAANLKVKQRPSDTQFNGQIVPEIQAKKKIIEAKQFSNQVRQQIFEMQNQDEEDNFLELCETLQKITKN